jgi:fructose transport system permease protein
MAKLVQGTPGAGEPIGWSIWLAFPAGLLVGMLGGAINGFLVTKVKLPPFIVTLGTFNVFLALTLTFTKGTVPSIEMDPFLLTLGNYVNI